LFALIARSRGRGRWVRRPLLDVDRFVGAKIGVADSSPVFRSEYALKPRPTTAANCAGVMGSALPPRERSRGARFASPRAT